MNTLAETLLDFIKIDIDSIYGCDFVNPEPDNWIEIIHYQGDEKTSWWRRLFGIKSTYKHTILLDKYSNKTYTLNEYVKNIENSNSKIYVNDSKYPIWHTKGIHIYLRNEYGNPNNVSRIFYIKDDVEINGVQITKDILINIVNYINLYVRKETYNDF